jgi:DNA-binding MarR family transcriptional regulator
MPSSNRAELFAEALARLDVNNSRVVAELVAGHETLSVQGFLAVGVLGLGPKRMGDLAARLAIAPASATALVDRLEAEGLVRRRRSERDRRVWLVELTDEGTRTVGEIGALYRQVATEMLAPLTEAEQETFVALFTKVVGALSGGG